MRAGFRSETHGHHLHERDSIFPQSKCILQLKLLKGFCKQKDVTLFYRAQGIVMGIFAMNSETKNACQRML